MFFQELTYISFPLVKWNFHCVVGNNIIFEMKKKKNGDHWHFDRWILDKIKWWRLNWPSSTLEQIWCVKKSQWSVTRVACSIEDHIAISWRGFWQFPIYAHSGILYLSTLGQNVMFYSVFSVGFKTLIENHL